MNFSVTPELLISIVVLSVMIYFAVKIGKKIVKIGMSFLSLWYFLTFTFPRFQALLGFIKASKLQSLPEYFSDIFQNIF